MNHCELQNHCDLVFCFVLFFYMYSTEFLAQACKHVILNNAYNNVQFLIIIIIIIVLKCYERFGMDFL